MVQAHGPGQVWTGPCVFVVADNHTIHRRKQTQALLARYVDRLSVMALPTCSPKLNLLESITQLLGAVEASFLRLDRNLAEVLSVIGNPA